MIHYKSVVRYEESGRRVETDGWYLFGIIPIYTRTMESLT